MRPVAIVGAAMTKFGELWDSSLRDIGLESGMRALMDAGLETEDVESLYLGNMSAGRFIQQEHIGALIADHAGLAYRGIPAIRVVPATPTTSKVARWRRIVVPRSSERISMSSWENTQMSPRAARRPRL